MKLRNVRLNLGNVARTTNAKSMSVNSASAIYGVDATGKRTGEITGFQVACSAYRGDELKVKFPNDVRVGEKIEGLIKQLENDIDIEISFKNLKLTAYAMLGADGKMISGVAAKAEDFEVIPSDFDAVDI